MRIAWFRPDPPDLNDPRDGTAHLKRELSARHDVTDIDASNACILVWMQARAPFDAVVYELADRPGAHVVWPYVLHYPGVTLLRNSTLAASRRVALHAERRHDQLRAETAFDRDGQWPMLRAPLLASRITAVPYRGLAEALSAEYPDARVRYLPPAVAPPDTAIAATGRVPVFGVFEDRTTERSIIDRAARRAADMGVAFELVADSDARRVVAASDVVLALHWPPRGTVLGDAVTAMAAGRPVIVLDTLETADWPSLDPQTWHPRAPLDPAPPICISLNLIDEEHSLLLAMRRLCADAQLGADLGQAAHRWWQEHLAPARAADAMETILEEARGIAPPGRPAGWPAHFQSDGAEHARSVIAEFGVEIDLLR